MKAKVRFPIALKLVSLTSLLLVSVSLVIAWKNSELFQQISTDREETATEMITSSKGLEVEAILGSYSEKLSSLAQEGKLGRPLSGDLLYYKFESDTGANSFESFNKRIKEDEFAPYRDALLSFRHLLGEIRGGNIVIASTAQALKEPFLLMGAPVAREQGVVTNWAWGIFRLNKLQASFQNRKNLKVYLLDARGKIIVHPDEKLTVRSEDFSRNKFVSQLMTDVIQKRQRYLDGVLYSSTKTMFGPIVVGEISEASIIAPARLAKEMSYFIMGIVLSLSFFLSVVFSQTLSRNLERLTHFAHEIAQGNFDVRAQDKIRSKDEIGLLANAFDDMTEGLKERDKIKNIFTKFHGAVITDTLMNQEDMRRGKKCEAVVFFSDIRGFTDFSNNKSPEEVVTMLNSYFEVMVGIINKRGGVVDKFVGDAIMAVWGAPNSTENDVQNAVMACLEMRKALAELNEKRIAEGNTAIMMGMGLHAGAVVAGTVGSNDRLEYTVIGDTVNTASRIESATKSFGTDFLVSEEVVKRSQDMFLFSMAGSTKVKGKDAPLKLAKVNGYYDENMNPCIVVTPYSEYESEESEKVKIVA